MRSAWFMAGIVAVAGLLGAPARGAEMRLAVIDMDRVLQAYPETKTSRGVLEKQLEEYEAEQKKMLAERDKLMKEVETSQEQAKNEALSQAAREKQSGVVEEKLADLRKYEREIRDTAGLRQRQLNDQRVRMQRRIVTKLREIVKGYCDKERIELVLDSTGVGAQGVELVVFGSDKLDITEAILALVAKEPKESKDSVDPKGSASPKPSGSAKEPKAGGGK